MRRTIAISVCVAALAILGPMKAFASDPCSGDIGGTPIPAAGGNAPDLGAAPGIVPVVSATSGPLYVDVREIAGPTQTFSIWVYEESNNKPALQRGGHSIFPDTPETSGAETCPEAKLQRVAPDQDIF